MARVSRRAFLASSAIALSAPAQAQEPKRFSFFEPVSPPRRTQVMVHRGTLVRAPENTYEAFEGCIQDYTEWGELDLRLTKDGKHVIFHDSKLDGKTNGSGLVSERTLAELQKLDAGAGFARRFRGTRLLSFPEALDMAKGKLNLYLDCKQIDPELMVREIQAAGMERQVIVYDRPAVIAKVRAASKGTVPIMTKYRPSMDFAAFMKEISPNAVEIDAEDVTAELCQRFHALGVVVQAKVLGNGDQPKTWAKMVDAGVNWLQTDDPAGIAAMLVQRTGKAFPVKFSCHRGASRYAPENTLPAIQKAVALGADFVEFDIRTTKDNRLVIMHDQSVNRTTNGKGDVRDLTFAEVRSLDAGAWFGKPFANTQVPTLDEVLAALGPKTSVYLDAKDVAPEALVSAVKNFGLFERHVVYQSAEYATRLKKIDARMRPLPPLRSQADLARVAECQPYGFDTAWRILSKDLVAACHARGIQVFSDAMGFYEMLPQYQKAIQMGLDVIQTDHPLRVLRAIELGMKS